MAAELPHFASSVRFELKRKIGEGGMGIVYEAFDRERKIPVALKTLSRVSPASLYLFKQEFRLIANISHPNLIPLYELFADSDLWYFTMELLDGTNLLEFVRAGCIPPRFSAAPTESLDTNFSTTVLTSTADMPTIRSPAFFEEVVLDDIASREPLQKGTSPEPRRLREALLQVAEGITALHCAGKLHRDIKPSNVLVSPTGRTLVLDFGLAVDEQSMRETGRNEIVGTFAYMSPEQFTGKPLSPATDWYSVGLVLYLCLCGEMPFQGRVQQMLLSKCEGLTLPPSRFADGVDPELERLAMDLLDPDPHRRPDGATILARLSEQREPGRLVEPARRDADPFVGRESELALLDMAVQTSAGGKTAFALVHGASGVGKTTLVQQYSGSIGDALVLRGRCYEQESVPYKAVDSAMDALYQHLLRLPRNELAALLPDDIRSLAQLFPVLNRLKDTVKFPPSDGKVQDPRRIRRMAVSALRDILRRLREEQPLLLVLDDLQWGDVDSILLLNEVFAPPNPPAVIVLCTYRREYIDRSGCLTALFSMKNTNHDVEWFDVALEPLSAKDTRGLVLKLVGSSPDAEFLVSRISEESGGNPYFVLELVRHTAKPRSDSPSTVRLEDFLLDRIANLPEESRRLLEIVAVHGQPLAQGDAYQAAGFASRDPSLLASLRFGNLVRCSGPHEDDQIEPFHDRVRETILHHLASDTKRSYHRELGQTLERSGRADSEALAFHFEYSGEPAKAGTHYERAGDRAAAALAFDRAAGHYRRCLELLRPAADFESTLRTKLAEALANSGRCVEAAREFELAATQASADTQFELERRAAFHYTASGHIEEGRATFERVLRRVNLKVPTTRATTVMSILQHGLLLRLQGVRFRERDPATVPRRNLERFDAAWSVAAPMGMIDLAQGVNFGMQSLLLAMKAGDPVRFIQGLQVAGYAIALEGQSGRKRAEELLAISRRLAAQRDDPRLLAITAFSEAAIAYVHAEWSRCCRMLDEAEDIYVNRCRGVHWELASIRTLRLYSLHTLGKFAELEQRIGSFLQEAEELGDLFSCANVEVFSVPITLMVADRPELARQRIYQGLKRWTARGYHLQNAMSHNALSYVALYEGSAPQSLAEVEERWRQLRAANFDRHENMRVAWLDFRLRTALAAAVSPEVSEPQRKQAWLATRDAHRSLGTETTPWGRAAANVATAAISEVDGGTNRAIELLLKAAEQFAALDMLAYAWSARRRAGDLIGGDRGTELVASADQWFESESVVRPDRMAAMHVGGFGDPARQRVPAG